MPRLVEPPPGSDLTEEWQFFLGLAKRMELELWFVNFFGGGGGTFMESPPVVVNFNGDTEMTTEELFAQMCSTSRIPLDEVASHPHGKIFDVDAVVEERMPTAPPSSTSATPYMLAELAEILARTSHGRAATPRIPFRLIPRRHGSFMNSSGTNLAELNRGKPYNPAYMHPDAIARAGTGDPVTW